MIVVSWLARTFDFNRGEFLGTGPTGTLWRGDAFAECARHVVLMQEDRQRGRDMNRTRPIISYLSDKAYRSKVELRDVHVADPTDFKALRALCEAVVSELEAGGQDVEAFVSPGTGTMQAVWYFLALTRKHRLRLFQTVAPNLHPQGLPGERSYINLDELSATAEIAKKGVERQASGTGLLRNTDSLREVYRRARAVAATNHISVLIQGPTGAGKEDLALHVHEESHRASRPFIRVNCAAFADNLLESRLFGYAKGAFTGADKDTKGIFEEADGGTLFLDEIGDISTYMQQTLLRVLQERTVQRMGSSKEIPVDIRVIAASHRNLLERCAAGEFRWDLYYRLAVVELSLKPLKDRPLAERRAFLQHALVQCADQFGRHPLKLSATVQSFLEAYPFPGNLRELRNVVENLYVFADEEGQITEADLPARLRQTPTSWRLTEAEHRHAQLAMAAFENNKTRVARELGITRPTLEKKLQPAKK